jgi:hypothetical protein
MASEYSPTILATLGIYTSRMLRGKIHKPKCYIHPSCHSQELYKYLEEKN